MFQTTRALVLRETRYKEADRILTLLTPEDGKLTVKARGALRKGSRMTAATQQLTYSEMTLFGNRGRWTVNEASLVEPFAGLREDIERFALGCYFAECLEAFAAEEQAEPELLQLGLNCLFALCQGGREPGLVKAAFELRLAALAGYAPETAACCVCGREEPTDPIFCLEEGAVCCRACRGAGMGAGAELDEGSLAALRFVLRVPPKQLLSFRLTGRSQELLERAAERYLLRRAERGFPTLDYWKSVKL